MFYLSNLHRNLFCNSYQRKTLKTFLLPQSSPRSQSCVFESFSEHSVPSVADVNFGCGYAALYYELLKSRISVAIFYNLFRTKTLKTSLPERSPRVQSCVYESFSEDSEPSVADVNFGCGCAALCLSAGLLQTRHKIPVFSAYMTEIGLKLTTSFGIRRSSKAFSIFAFAFCVSSPSNSSSPLQPRPSIYSTAVLKP